MSYSFSSMDETVGTGYVVNSNTVEEVSCMTDDKSAGTPLGEIIGKSVFTVFGLRGGSKKAEEQSHNKEGDDDDFVDKMLDDADPMSTPTLLRKARSERLKRVRVLHTDHESIDFLSDEKKDMTYGRRIALHLMKTAKWYNPTLRKIHEEKDSSCTDSKNDNKPSLEKAWAYFEHVTLPRYIVPSKNKADGDSDTDDQNYRYAEPGESHFKTRLYHPIRTPLKEMGDFGIGVGLYFSTLWGVTVMTFIAGLINIPNILYFAGEEYSANQIGLRWNLKGSAVCTLQEFVPCPQCSTDDYASEERYRIQQIQNSEGDTLTFALRNVCKGVTIEAGIVSLVTTCFVFCGLVLMSYYLRRKEIEFDESEQTTQDYSCVILNPPVDADDPEEWKQYFESSFDDVEVTLCSVIKGNADLINALVKRRECLDRIKFDIPSNESLDIENLEKLVGEFSEERNIFQRFFSALFRSLPENYEKLLELNKRVKELSSLNRDVIRVFVTFETEKAQRHILSASTSGDTMKDRRFRNEVDLQMEEAPEPSSVRWQDLNVSLGYRLSIYALTTLISCGMIVSIAFLVEYLMNTNVLLASFTISGSGVTFPTLAKWMTNVEAHRTEGRKQNSIYLKIAIFRWVSTAIIISSITPYTSTEDLLVAVFSIFFAELVTINIYQLSDPFGNIMRHVIAPRAKRQEAMNKVMHESSTYEIAERYTNMTKILFLTVWYCPIYPAAFFMCSFILFVNFYTDRFSLMYTWKQAPRIGPRISKFNRQYFFPLTILAMALVAAYTWAGFQFDNLCGSGVGVDETYAGSWNLTRTDTGVSYPFTVDQDTEAYSYCSQRMMEYAFPPVPSFQQGDGWMSTEQKTITSIYGILVFVMIAVVALFFVGSIVKHVILSFFPKHTAVGEDKQIPYSDVIYKRAYIPQVESSKIVFPLIACPTDDLIGSRLFSWKDNEKSHEYYDLSRDLADVMMLDQKTERFAISKKVLGTVSYWDPLS